MDIKRARKAHRKWRTAQILAKMSGLPRSFREKMRKRERRYCDARHYGAFRQIRTAQTLSFARDSGKRCIFIDVTNSSSDTRIFGFSRVVNKIAGELLKTDFQIAAVEPVKYDKFGEIWRHATSFKSRFASSDTLKQDEPIINFRDGDVFLGLDWNPVIFGDCDNNFRAMKEKGVKIAFVVYDIIPIYRPELFVHGFADKFCNWLLGAAHIADELICISQSVAAEVDLWLEGCGSIQTKPKLTHFYLGSDLVQNESAMQMSFKRCPGDSANTRHKFLMVGTVEPRKGYKQALEAFLILWKQGLDVELTIVGRQGWLVDDLARALRGHLANGRLIWLRDTNDAQLIQLYKQSSALLAASEAEGFGLPLVEAAVHSLPIIARDIPVFREILRDGAYFFSGREPEVLANTVRQWMTLKDENRIPDVNSIPINSWREASMELIHLII